MRASDRRQSSYFARTISGIKSQSAILRTLVEPLEGRVLLSASPAAIYSITSSDALISVLTPTLGKVVLPNAVVAGSKCKAKIPVVITNSGSTPFKGEVQINLYADTVNSLDGNQALVMTEDKKIPSLKSEKSKTYPCNIKALPSTLPDGTYYLLAEVVDPTGASNVVATTQTVIVAAPFVQPSVVVGSPLQGNVVIGKSETIPVTITNDGNIAGAGVNIELTPSQDDATSMDGIVLENLTSGMKIQPGHSKTLRLHFKATSELSPGPYYPYVSVALGGVWTTNVGAATFNVTASATSGGSVDFLTVLGFNDDGGSWNYNITAHADGISATGTASAAVTADSSTSWDWTDDITPTSSNVEGVNEDLTWEQTDTGVNLDALSETAGWANETITFENPQICGPLLSGTSITTTPITIQGTGLSDGLDGNAKLTTKLVGNKTITVPAGTFSATEISLTIAFSASGSTDAGNISLHGTDTETFYGVNGVGLVKAISAAAETETLSGQGTTNINDVFTSELSNYGY